MKTVFPITLLAATLLCSCAKHSDAPHATVSLRDGTTVSGVILSNTSAGVQLTGDDNVTRTIPMSQVRSIDYGDAPTPPATAPPSPAEAPPTGPPDPVHDSHYHPVESAITTKTYQLPAGTTVSVRTEETVDSARAAEGQTFAAEVTADVRDAAGDCVIPRASNAQLVIKSASRGGRFRGSSDLIVDLISVSVDGHRYTLDSSDVSKTGRQGVGANKRTGEFVGGGAAIGAIIGAIAGHGKGAAIGAGAGAGGGALTQILTRGTVKIPAESILTFRLDAPLQVVAR